MLKKELPIGFFDSGIGGMSVLMHAVGELPKESFIFYGDNKNAPYGTKTEEEIKELSLNCCEFLYNKGVKAVVIACNTATSVSVKIMRELYGIPVVSIEPAVKPAYENLKNGKILVMATPATLSQKRYLDLCERVGCTEKVINMPCKGLVEIIEKGDFSSPELEGYLCEKFEQYKSAEIDGIVIGCTHYSFVSEKIMSVAKSYFRGELKCYDGMFGTVRQLKRVLERENLLSETDERTVEFFSSKEDSVDIFKKIYSSNIEFKAIK